MLDQPDTLGQLDLLSQCRDNLQLTPEAAAMLRQSGFAPSCEDDRRRRPRRRVQWRVPLLVLSTLPALSRAEEWHASWVIDISRSGAGLLHWEQLYPCERLRLALPDDGMRLAEVVWCQRLGANCFHIGSRFIEDELQR